MTPKPKSAFFGNSGKDRDKFAFKPGGVAFGSWVVGKDPPDCVAVLEAARRVTSLLPYQERAD